MDPERLIRWEPVLESQLAVSLLLLAALILALGWCAMLYRDNRELNRIFREHLRAQGDFRAVIDHVREVMRLRGGAR